MYRRRLIPDECVLLKDDRILSFEDGRLVTEWNALKPKKELHHGISCFFFKENIKLSKFYRADNSLIYWYTDIISTDIVDEKITDHRKQLRLPYSVSAGKTASGADIDDFFKNPAVLIPQNTSKENINAEDNYISSQAGGPSLVVTDLLADILIYPDGFVKVVDLGEIADAISRNLIEHKTAAMILRVVDRTLESIYSGDFKEYQDYLEKFES